LAGKIKILNRTYSKYGEIKNFLKKKRRMRILSARIFLSLLAGKLKPFKPMLLRKKLTQKIQH